MKNPFKSIKKLFYKRKIAKLNATMKECAEYMINRINQENLNTSKR